MCIIGTPPKYLDKIQFMWHIMKKGDLSIYILFHQSSVFHQELFFFRPEANLTAITSSAQKREEGGGVPVQMSVLIHRNISGGRVVDLDGPQQNIGVMVGQTQ